MNNSSKKQLEEKLRRMIGMLDEMKKQLEDIALDEMSEAHAYAETSKIVANEDPESAWMLFLVASDSILHREIAWAILRSISEMQVLAKELIIHLNTESPLEIKQVFEMVKAHMTIEEFAKSSYQGLIEYAEPDTSLYKMLEMLVEEEEKHKRLASNVIARLLERMRTS